MAHVVMQAAEFATAAEAERCEAELRGLMDSYAEFERTDPSPWSEARVPPPLVAFGERHGVEWPLAETSRFLLKGRFDEVVELLRVDRMVFFWGGGFDLGGPTLRAIFQRLGAVAVAEHCPLVIRCDDPAARLAELTAFLDEEDWEGQYTVADDLGGGGRLHSLTLEGPGGRRHLVFRDSGVQDWAFTAVLPQLDGEDPRLDLPRPAA